MLPVFNPVRQFIDFCSFLTSAENPHTELVPLMREVIVALRGVARAAGGRGDLALALHALQSPSDAFVRACHGARPPQADHGVKGTPVRARLPGCMFTFRNALRSGLQTCDIAIQAIPHLRRFPTKHKKSLP
jgi:hypothetical protein